MRIVDVALKTLLWLVYVGATVLLVACVAAAEWFAWTVATQGGGAYLFVGIVFGVGALVLPAIGLSALVRGETLY